MSFYDVTPHARQSQASPSVSLEKGAYRLRAPPQRYKPHTRHDSRPSRDGIRAAIRYEKQMAVLVIFLVCATVTCFAAAYYLFTTRWGTPTHSHPTSSFSDVSTHPQVVAEFNLSANALSGGPFWGELGDPEERFLAYLPHSGFHNQRIAFENALVLSRLLNRTLLVPPVRLGKPLFYAPYDNLKEMLANTSKSEAQHCRPYTSSPDFASDDCIEYFQYTDVPWRWLVDLSGIETRQKLLDRWDFTDDWLYDNADFSDGDIFVVRDTDRDMYGFQDFISLSGTQTRKYRRMIHLSTLAHRTERIILLGTLFGTSRLHLRSPANLQLRKEVRTQMARSQPFLVDVARAIWSDLGQDYLGAHIRLGDGIFEDDAEDNVRTIWWRLVHEVLGFGVEDAMRLEHALTGLDLRPPPDSPLEWNSQIYMAQPLRLSPLKISHLPCRAPLHSDPRLARLNTALYISTDSEDPDNDARLHPMLATFPCVFFLADFPERLAPLVPLQSPLDGLLLEPFLEPLLDALVVARASRVIGTEGSTFSQFVEDVLWRLHHGYEIVSKG